MTTGIESQELPMDYETFLTSTTKSINKNGDEIDVNLSSIYGYEKVTADSLYYAGCTLATAAYMAYSITGNLFSLIEANEIVYENSIFTKDSDGLYNNLTYNTSYVDAVNALAGDKVIEYARSSWSGYQDFLVTAMEDDEYYFATLRTDTGKHSVTDDPEYKYYHSVLFNDFTVYEEGNITGVNIIDPWTGEKKEERTFDEIGRVDLYSLTEKGKDIYANTIMSSNDYKEWYSSVNNLVPWTADYFTQSDFAWMYIEYNETYNNPLAQYQEEELKLRYQLYSLYRDMPLVNVMVKDIYHE